ncbi:MAG: phosphorylase family protein [Leucobacter sp.]
MADTETLLVFAHRDEASAFRNVPHLVTGVGKTAAAASLAHALASGRAAADQAARSEALATVGVRAADNDGAVAPHLAQNTNGYKRVIVLGTAGLISDAPGTPAIDTVYQVVGAVQHDFSLPSPELIPSGPVILPPERTAVVATGDTFVQDDEQRTHIAGLGATLVDMETYAYASVCERFGIPLQVFKVPSDFADSGTSDEEWDTIVFRKSEQLREFCVTMMPEIFTD